MGPTIIARNYAETLLALARRHGGEEAVDAYASALDELTEMLRRDPRIQSFLATPRLGAATKKRVLRETLSGRVPEPFLRFLLVVIEKRRQTILRLIAEEYRALVDEARGRVRAEVSVAREPDEALRREVVSALERRFGKTVLASFRVDPSLVGGVVVRVGDEVLDGSLRQRISGLRRRLLTSRLPRMAAGTY